MDLDAYLDRIGYHGERAPTLDNLRAMHRAHAFKVPFENLDIARGIRIEVDERVNFDKIVRSRRGGFCLELTGMFGRALRQMGYEVDVIGARVLMEGRLGQPMSHMILVVHLDEPWIADVGFGGRVIEPLRLHETGDQVVGNRRFNVGSEGDLWFVTCTEDGNPQGMYMFSLHPREFEEFNHVCNWLQTSPDSRFTAGNIVSLATEDGRHTLAGGRLISTKAGDRQEREVLPAEEPMVLAKVFGLT